MVSLGIESMIDFGVLLESFITLLVVMDPIGNLPLFISLTKGMPTKEIKRNVNRSVFVAGFLLFIFLFFGLKIFDFFRIDLDSFQIASGVILLIIGILHVFGLYLKMVKSQGPDLSVPIGTPLLTGPGVIIISMVLVKENGHLVTVIAALSTLLVTWLVLMHSSKIYKILGEHWTNVTSRIMGIILAAIAIEFIKEGVLNVIVPFFS